MSQINQHTDKQRQTNTQPCIRGQFNGKPAGERPEPVETPPTAVGNDPRIIETIRELEKIKPPSIP